MQRKNQHRLVRLSSALAMATVFIVLLAARMPSAASARPLAQAVVPSVQFSSATVSVVENTPTGKVTIFVTLDISTTNTVEVDYITINGTATAGSDFVSASGKLTFAPGIQSQNFSVTIINDSLFEGDENLNLVLRNQVNATLGSPSAAVLTILEDDSQPTATPTPTVGAPPVFVDSYEPNNTLVDAYTTAADATKLCSITLWPTGDEDYFKFWGRNGSVYELITTDLKAGLDTVLTVYNPQGGVIGTNDDYQVADRASKLVITANVDGFHYARVVNQDPTDPANKTYCLTIKEIVPPTPMPTSTVEAPAGDVCEYNSTLDTACLIGVGEKKSLDFVPAYGSTQDTDIFRLWMKPNILYTCETSNLSSVNDTNIILIDGNGSFFNPPIGNDDKAPGDLGSKVSYLSTYTGWLYIMVGPVNPPPLADADLYTYDLTCTADASTPTPTATATFVPVNSGGTGSATRVPTATPIVFPTFPPTPTPIDVSQFATQVSAPPVVSFQPLPTATPRPQEQQISSVSITLYYDANSNFTPELTEGIVDVAVALYDNATGKLVQFGHTNEAGALSFGSIAVSGAVRIEVPYLNYSQIVVGTSTNILLRIAPQPLPASIP